MLITVKENLSKVYENKCLFWFVNDTAEGNVAEFLSFLLKT